MSQDFQKEKFFCSFAFNYHDSSVAFAIGKKVVLVLEAERVFRVKKKACSKEEMEYLVAYGLGILGKKSSDVDHWVMTTFNNPYLVENDFIDFDKKLIKEPFWKKIEIFGSINDVLIINHHLAHAGIYLATEYKSAIIISCDGGGDIDPRTRTNECLAIFEGDHDKISRKNIFLKSFISGKTYGVCCTFIYGSKLHEANSNEGKLMALAGYGQVRDEYYDFLKQNLNTLEHLDYPAALDLVRDAFPDLQGQAALPTDAAKDFAASVHTFFINKRMENIGDIVNQTFVKQEALILTGGTSLNIDLNSRVYGAFPKLKHFIAPCCDDTGQSLGALCILVSNILKVRPMVDLPYLGEGVERFNYTRDTIEDAVDILLKDGILMLHNGKAEVGPRALGNRSFIARPDKLAIKEKVSQSIKQREGYRPVAPVVLIEKVEDYFIGPPSSPFMLYMYKIKDGMVKKIIGGAHIDQTARVQTVNRDENPFLYDLIKSFGKKTGIYVLLNTSLNLKGEPLANRIEDSLKIYSSIDGQKGIIYNGDFLDKAV